MAPAPKTARQLVLKLCEDETRWGLSDIQDALGLASWDVVLKLWNATLNYVDGGATGWPPVPSASRRRLPRAPDSVPRVLWWPSEPGVLPVPEFVDEHRRHPQWRAGAIRRWALKVGRMTLDGRPMTPASGGRVDPTPPGPPRPASEQLRRQVLRFVDDDTVWTIDDIQRFFGVSEQVANKWLRGVRNRVAGGVRTWPPTTEDLYALAPALQRQPQREMPEVNDDLWWPAYPSLLPPPLAEDVPDDDQKVSGGWWGGTRPLRWRAGAVKSWGLKVGRIDLNGDVVLSR